MDKQELFDLELDMRLINNRPINSYIGYLYSPTINEITDIGIITYNIYTTLLCLSFDELKKYKYIGENSIAEDIYEWLAEQCSLHAQYETYILDGLSMFFKEKVSFDVYFYIGEFDEYRFIDKKTFDYIQNIIKKICCVENIQEDIDNPANDKARELLEKRKKYKQKLKRAKQNNGEETLTLSDLISIYCADGNEASILTVGNYSMYQFNNQFNRMEMLEDYNINIQALIHGADSKDELQSWMRKIKAED